MKSKLVKSLCVCGIVIAVAFGGYYGYNKFFKVTTVKAATQYLTMSARKMNMQVTIQGTGAAYAAVTKDVMANNAGTLKDLNVKVGDTVTAGEKLFTSDSDDLTKNVTSAQNNLNKQKLTLQSDQTALSNAQTQLSTANAAAQSSANSKTSSQGEGQSNQDPQQAINSAQSAVASAQNRISMDQLAINDAQSQLTYANEQLSKSTVIAPIGGLITAVNNTNSDSVSPGKAVLSIVDMSSLKIKVQVDELDIEKVKIGQNTQILFDAIKDKNYDGTVESISETGTTSNNVTTYDVVVDITNPTGIKIGMNANVTIQVDSKDNVLTIPTEALIDRNGQKYVLVPNTTGTTSISGNQNSSNGNSSNGDQSAQNSSGNNQGQQTSNQNAGSQGGNAKGSNGQGRRNGTNGSSFSFSGSGKLVKVQTGLENENNVEITEGLNDGDKVLVQLPQTSSTTTNKNASAAGYGGGFGGSGNFGGGNRTQGGGNNSSKGN